MNTPGKRDKKHAAELSPYPLELIAFQPLDGADTRFGQLYKPIKAEPFASAGLKGFLPSNPYQVEPTADSNLLIPIEPFHWPTLDELNRGIHDWDRDKSYREYMQAALFAVFAARATGPPPEAPHISIPVIPSLEALNAVLILSEDRLFFISVSIGPNIREWRLAQLDFETSAKLSPASMLTGRYLFEFYHCHPADYRFNAINQRYWLQYFSESDILHPDQASQTHLVKPSTSSRVFASKNKLVPARQFVHLLHEDTFIHGPFNFATINNRKTRDRIAMQDWTVLESHKHLVRNAVPPFDVPAYSVHVDSGVDFCFHDRSNADMLLQRKFLPPADTQFTDRAADNSDYDSLFNSDEDSLFSDVQPDV